MNQWLFKLVKIPLILVSFAPTLELKASNCELKVPCAVCKLVIFVVFDSTAACKLPTEVCNSSTDLSFADRESCNDFKLAALDDAVLSAVASLLFNAAIVSLALKSRLSLFKDSSPPIT